MQIRDRVKEFKRLKASEIQPNPKNWRTHPQAQQDALRGVLAEVGIAGALIVRKLPAGGYMLLDGHMRADVSPETKWPCLVLDVDDAEAAKLLATFDPISAMAEADSVKLDALLREIATGNEALQAMLAELAEDAGLYRIAGEHGENDPEAEWEGMPEYDNDTDIASSVIVYFASPADRIAFSSLIGQNLDNAKSAWFPPKQSQLVT